MASLVLLPVLAEAESGQAECGRVGWNAIAVLLTSPSNSAPGAFVRYPWTLMLKYQVWLPASICTHPCLDILLLLLVRLLADDECV